MKRRLMTTLAVLGTLLSLNLVGAGPALAGSNGQQLDFLDYIGDTYTICVTGYNNQWVWTSQCWPTPGWSTDINGWWWQDNVTINEYNGSGTFLRQITGWFNESQSQDYTCARDDNGAYFACYT